MIEEANMRTLNSTKLRTQRVLFAFAVLCVAGCSSSVKKVMPKGDHDIAALYTQYSGGNSQQHLATRKRELQLRDQQSLELRDTAASTMMGFPPQPEQLEHLFPKLPNPELFMYVRPHAVGATGAPIPAYMTRFQMYERDHYALPGETVDTIRRNEQVIRAEEEQKHQAQLQAEAERRKQQQRARHNRGLPKGGVKP
jgi:conjugative transfer region lipoprotein (TIGR03751 family)